MDPFSITGTLIAVVQITSTVISICYDYRSSLKSASREIIQITDGLNSLKDVLESLLRVVERTQSSDNNDASRLATFELLIKKGGPLMTCQEELERLKGKLEPETGWRKVRKALVWPLKEGEMTKAMEALERLKGTMQLALSADQAALSLAIKDDVGDLTQMFLRHSADQDRQAAYTWLAGPDPSANHIANKKKRQPNTGTWLVASKTYEHWLYGSRSFLWLYGIPGSGKSVLCSTLIEQLVQHCEQGPPKTAVAYFYFDFNDTGKRDIGNVVRSLIIQLSTQCYSVPTPLLELYQNHGNGTRAVEDTTLITTLRSLVLIFHNVYLVFDALDESSDCDEVLKFIHQIQEWELSRLHLTVTSRQLPEIEESLADLVTDKICLHESELNEDIFLYVTDKLENDKIFAKWPSDIRLQIQMKLLSEEDGMFQWVVCQLDMLRHCMSVNAIRKAMSALPKSLDETYERLLLGVDESNQPEVMKILQALTVTVDPLTSGEIVEILAIDLDPTPPQFEPDSRLLDPRSIISMCSSLVNISSEQQTPSIYIAQWNPFTDKQRMPTLKLAHASVADYLTRPNPFPPSKFHFSKNEARQFMAQTCLTYLLNPEFARGDNSIHWPQMEKRLQSFPFLRHCVSSWPIYLKKESGDPEDHLSPRTKEILQIFFSTSKLPNGGNFAAWVRMLIPGSPASNVQNTTPLYYAASFGLLEVVRIILDTDAGLDINALGGRPHTTALHAAVYRDHTDVVRLLLERGADPKIPNNLNETPMYFAVAHGNEDIEALLIQYGAGSKWYS